MDWNSTGVDVWGARTWEQMPFTKDHFARIMAHEIGHFLGLGHPYNGQCHAYPSMEEGLLMAQQRKITVEGQKCSRRTAALEAVTMSLDNIEKARARVSILDGVTLPSVPNALRVGISMQQVKFVRTEFSTLGLSNAIVFPTYALKCSGTLVRARVLFAEGTKPEFDMVFFTTTPGGSKLLQLQTVHADLRPYLHHRHAELDLMLPVHNGSLVGMAPVSGGGTKVFPVFVGRKLSTPNAVHWRPVVLDTRKTPPEYKPVLAEVDLAKVAMFSTAWRAFLACVVNFDMVCVA